MNEQIKYDITSHTFIALFLPNLILYLISLALVALGQSEYII